MLEIISGVVALISFLTMILVIYNNKFHFAIIKIDEAESNLDVLLFRKLGLLERTRPIIMKELKIDEFLDDLSELENKNLNHFELNDKLKDSYDELYRIISDNEKLLKSESLSSLLQSLDDNEADIIGSIKFYNDTVVIFNQLVTSFPAKVVAFFHRYKRKEFYNDEDKEMYQIIND